MIFKENHAIALALT